MSSPMTIVKEASIVVETSVHLKSTDTYSEAFTASEVEPWYPLLQSM